MGQGHVWACLAAACLLPAAVLAQENGTALGGDGINGLNTPVACLYWGIGNDGEACCESCSMEHPCSSQNLLGGGRKSYPALTCAQTLAQCVSNSTLAQCVAPPPPPAKTSDATLTVTRLVVQAMAVLLLGLLLA